MSKFVGITGRSLAHVRDRQGFVVRERRFIFTHWTTFKCCQVVEFLVRDDVQAAVVGFVCGGRAVALSVSQSHRV